MEIEIKPDEFAVVLIFPIGAACAPDSGWTPPSGNPFLSFDSAINSQYLSIPGLL